MIHEPPTSNRRSNRPFLAWRRVNIHSPRDGLAAAEREAEVEAAADDERELLVAALVGRADTRPAVTARVVCERRMILLARRSASVLRSTIPHTRWRGRRAPAGTTASGERRTHPRATHPRATRILARHAPSRDASSRDTHPRATRILARHASSCDTHPRATRIIARHAS